MAAIASLAEPRRRRIAIITNIIPHYREDFYRRISQFSEIDISVYCQSSIQASDIATAKLGANVNIQQVQYIGLKNEKFGFQTLPILRILKEHDLYIVHGNPRILSNVFISFALTLFGKTVAIWGQAHTYAAVPIFERMKLIWWRRFKNLIVYNDSEVIYLRQRNFVKNHIIGLNNGLNQQAHDEMKNTWHADRLDNWRKDRHLEGRVLLLSCARLITKNRFDLMLEALSQLKSYHKNLVWCVIGTGSEGDNLKRQANNLNLGEHVRWLGEMYDEHDLAPWFLSSYAFIHPSAVGLSLMHAFGYGLPVITHDERQHHGPEISALSAGVNGHTFERDNARDLARAIDELLHIPAHRNALAKAALDTVRTKYNTAEMASRFVKFCASLGK